jgi:hypothetical protein
MPKSNWPNSIDRDHAAHEKLKREIYELEQVIQSNASALASKTMYDRDRESLRRQMDLRVAHQRLLQRRLDRLRAREMSAKP